MIVPRLAAARGSRSPRASGAIAVDTTARIDILMCQLSSRCCSSDANGTIASCPIEPPAVATPTTLLGRRLPADGAEARPEPGRRHANPTDHFAERQNEARGRERGHETCRRRKEDRRWRPYAPCRSGRRCRRETARTRPSAASPALTTTARGRLCGRRRSVSERGPSSAARRFRSSGSRRRKSPETRICAAAARQLRLVRA